ncbi:hypothetical protein IDH22_00875 [Pelagibacterales bacterium SAG-MED35]|nr:hypothetical protein [Pelagibacterales bacterium SAG-MED35]
MNKKIFFFFSQPYNSFNQDRFSFNFLKKKGYEPIYVDLSAFFTKNNHQYKLKKNIKIIKINSLKDFLIFLKRYKKKFYFIDLTTYSSFIFNIFQKILSNRGCLKIHISTSIINFYQLLSPRQKFLIYVKKFEILKIFFSFLRFIKRGINNLFKTKPNFIFISGRDELKKFSNFEKVYSSCSLDYNTYIKSKISSLKKKSKQIVYLDQNFLHHRDFLITKEGNINRKNFLKFYERLKIFIKKIQREEKCRIVICMHPRSEKNSLIYLKKLFKSKNIIFSWKTNQEIQKSKLVIFNYSNSHQIAVLHKKPMLIVHNLSNKYYDYELKKNIINKISNDLDIPIVNLNRNFQNFKLQYKININKYNKYIKNYLSSIYPKKVSSWSIINEILRKNNL